MDNSWILSFAIGVASGLGGLLTSIIGGAVIAVATGAGMGYIYKKFSDAIRKMKDYMS